MALREFDDREGTRWQVWRVRPTAGAPPAYDGPERRARAPETHLPERRRRLPSQRVLTPGLEAGWLCFESADEKRRLTPVPDDWDRCPDEQLRLYCQQARIVRTRAIPTSLASPAPSAGLPEPA